MEYEKDRTWTKADFENLDPGMYGDFYICERGFGRKGYHLAKRTFAGLGGVDWETIKYLTDQEVVAALEAGITPWQRTKPVIRVKANYSV